MKIRVAVLVFAMGILVSMPSWAGTISFADCSTVTTTKPVTCSGGSSTVLTLTYSSGIVATGYHFNGGSQTDAAAWGYTNLAIKNAGADETGLGVLDDPSGDNEITFNDAISLDLLSLGNGTGFWLNMGSLAGDSYRYCWAASATSDCMGSAVTGITDPSIWLTVNSVDPFLFVSASNGNVLVSSITIPDSQVPEPSSMMLLGSGLVGLAGIVRRKISR